MKSHFYRAHCIPEEDYQQLDRQEVKTLTREFASEHEQKFGEHSTKSNFHSYGEHADEFREQGPFPKYSTYQQESFYGDLRRVTKSGTRSECKQGLTNTYSKLKLKKDTHKCKADLKLTRGKSKPGTELNTGTNRRINDSLISLSVSTFGEVVDFTDDEVTYRKIYTTPFATDFSESLRWEKVGVCVFDRVSDETFTIPRSKIYGKAVSVRHLIISAPRLLLWQK